MAKRLIPALNRVLVEKIVPPAKTNTGILLPEKTTKLNSGTVVAVGPGARDRTVSSSLSLLRKGTPCFCLSTAELKSSSATKSIISLGTTTSWAHCTIRFLRSYGSLSLMPANASLLLN
ncbi:hypothetical protein MLD38_009509 [Melastoma candidum]|uniref:Uncharacterized protein n=1 Tax=Melastoma candidum TaxID=119954 RepID=A0ACB9S248_9MYRT|nr:hypothetical protein MLD38_009509 [Melastoma candidum]